MADNIQVIGPSSGGGGGGTTIDGTTIYQTGDLKPRYGTGVHPTPAGGISPGWVRCNGLTIGSASSSPSATERGSADCQALFEYLWITDSALVVSAGRGANAHADWVANKTIATPDYRSYNIGGLDGMGNTAANRLGAYFANADLLGSVGGSPSAAIGISNLPPHTHSGTTNSIPAAYPNAQTHSHPITEPGTVNATASLVTSPGGPLWAGTTPGNTGATNTDHTHPFTTDGGTGTSVPLATISPRKLCTIYIKL